MEAEQLFLELDTCNRLTSGDKLQLITIGACIWKHNAILPGKQRILAANSPSPCMFPLKIGRLIFFSLQGKYICSFSIDCKPLEGQQRPCALRPTVVTETVVRSGWGSEPHRVGQRTRIDELKQITEGNSLPQQHITQILHRKGEYTRRVRAAPAKGRTQTQTVVSYNCWRPLSLIGLEMKEEHGNRSQLHLFLSYLLQGSHCCRPWTPPSALLVLLQGGLRKSPTPVASALPAAGYRFGALEPCCFFLGCSSHPSVESTWRCF